MIKFYPRQLSLRATGQRNHKGKRKSPCSSKQSTVPLVQDEILEEIVWNTLTTVIFKEARKQKVHNNISKFKEGNDIRIRNLIKSKL